MEAPPQRQKPVLPVLSSPGKTLVASTPSRRRWWPSDTVTPRVSELVQGRFDGPVERYRVASKGLCRVTSVLGWSAVVIGAGEVALGAFVFSQWRREGGWWAGFPAVLLGIAATGISADTPVHTALVAWLIGLGLASLVTSLVTVLTLDFPTWLDVKDVVSCVAGFDSVCQYCACTASDNLWDICFSPGDGNCGAIESAGPALLTSSVVLLVLALVSALLVAAGVKIKYLRGDGEIGRQTARPDPFESPRDVSYPCSDDPEPPAASSSGANVQELDQQPGGGWGATREVAGASGVGLEEGEEEERKDSGTSNAQAAKEGLTGAEPWAVTYVDRLAGGGNKKRRDFFSVPGIGGGAHGGVGGEAHVGFASL